MSAFSIEEVTAQDIDQLREIGRQTFKETFAASNPAANLHAYLAEAFAPEKLRAELQTPGSAFYFVRLSGAVVGYLKVNTGPAQTELKDAPALEIERIYVLQAFHGQGVGQLLYEKALQLARQHQVEYLWLGVWEENPRAIRFYEKNGFVAFDKHVFRLGDDEQTDIMMKLPLTPSVR